MLEPSKPVTLKTRYTPYPAIELQRDEGRVLQPHSIILRHRHLKQQFTIVPSASRQRSGAFAPPGCAYQPAPSSVVPAVIPLPAVVGVAASVAHGPPSAAAHSLVVARAGDAGRAGPSASIPLAPAGEIPPGIYGASSGKGSDVSSTQLSPVEAPHRNISRGHEVVETSDSSLVVRRAQRAIRDKKGQTTWFYSNGQTYLLEPPLPENVEVGDLYVHTTANRDQQIWIFNRSSRWEKIQLCHPHPVLSGYILHRVSDGEPRWIQKTTLTTYRGREKRYRQICSQRETNAVPATSSSHQAARLTDSP